MGQGADPEKAPESLIVVVVVWLWRDLAAVPLPAAVPQSGFGGDVHPTGGACCCRGLAEENRLLSVKT